MVRPTELIRPNRPRYGPVRRLCPDQECEGEMAPVLVTESVPDSARRELSKVGLPGVRRMGLVIFCEGGVWPSPQKQLNL